MVETTKKANFAVKPERVAQLPACQVATDLPSGMKALKGSTKFPNLFESSNFPGLLFKKIKKFDDAIAGCNGIFYEFDKINGGYNATLQVVLIGSTFQWALDHMFYDPTMEYSSGAATDNLMNMRTTLMETLADEESSASWDANFDGSRGTRTLLKKQGLGSRDQSGWGLKNAMGIYCDASAGFGTNNRGMQSGAIDGFTAVKRLELATISRILQDKGAEIFGGAGDAQKYVDKARAEYLVSGAHKDVKLSVPLMVQVVTRTSGGFETSNPQPGTRFGLPRIHASRMAWEWPTLENPYGNPACYIDAVGDTGKSFEGSILTGMLLANAANVTTGVFDQAAPTGTPFAKIVERSLANISRGADALLGDGAAKQAPVYDGNGALVSVGSMNNVSAPASWFVDALQGPYGYGGLAEMMDATQWIVKRAEALAKE